MSVGIRSAVFLLTIGLVVWPAARAADNLVIDPSGKSDGGLAFGIQFGPATPVSPSAINPCVLEFEARTSGMPPAPLIALQPRLPPSTVTGISSKQTCFGNQFGLDFYTENAVRLSITQAGKIGIGTANPIKALHIEEEGDVEVALASKDTGGRVWTIQSTGAAQVGQPVAGTFQIIDRTSNQKRLWIGADGTVNVNVLQINGGSDIAEPFRGIGQLPAGSVVVIDSDHPGRLKQSDRAYDVRVAGIVSGANGVRTGLTLDQLHGEGSEQYVALSGRVYALADATRSAIRAGDLLTSSMLPGRVMKADNRQRAEGAVIGKAMSSLDRGTGYVLVLVGLH